MPEYCFFKKGQQIIALERSAADGAFQLTEQGYEKQFEEVNAADEKDALARFADIRKEQQIDHHNFLSGAISMPLIGVLAAAFTALFRKK
ncbi:MULTISPECIES: hypothetical protein [Enterobacteriaceae]|uniref:hypothetical protein n=1 Tax=Enterobacteriaceae TaxID=543 RepID=UPI002017EFC2|nr:MULTISPECIES: hypothetical protein [Enterobacteriaceae]